MKYRRTGSRICLSPCRRDQAIPAKKYNQYGDDIVVERIELKKLTEELAVLEEIIASKEVDIVDDQDSEWLDDRSKPEVEVDDELQQIYEQELTNLRVSEWLNEMTDRVTDPKETNVGIQVVDCGSLKYLRSDKQDSSWAAQEGSLFIPTSNLHLTPDGRSTMTSIDIFVRRVGVGLTHTEKISKKIEKCKRNTRFTGRKRLRP